MRTLNSNNGGDVVVAANADWSGAAFVYWRDESADALVRSAGAKVRAADLVAGRYGEGGIEIPPAVFARAVAIAASQYALDRIAAAAGTVDIDAPGRG